MKIVNKFSKMYIGILIVASAAFLGACTEDTTIDTENSTPVLVVYGTITDHNVRQEIDLSSSTGYFDQEENKRISKATVTLEEDSTGISNSYTLTQDSVGSGIYKTQQAMTGKPGWTYKLTVNTDFDQDGAAETYQAESEMPKRVILDSISITKLKEGSYTLFSLNISAQDPANEKNYYLCRYSINDTLYNKISKYIYFDDTSLDGTYVKDLAIWHFYDKGDKSKFSDSDAEDMVFLSAGDKIYAEVSNITKGYYNFIEDCQAQKDGSNPMFGGPPANISTNISNGARGYFTAFSTSSASYVAPMDFTE
jgi:hypothetical protein